MKESELKSAVASYLQLGMNMGKWYFDRLNSGKILAVYNGAQRMINMCRPGTADFFVLQNLDLNAVPYAYFIPRIRLVFLELKGSGGKQTQEQKDFEVEVTRHGAEYFVIRSIDELKEILPL